MEWIIAKFRKPAAMQVVDVTVEDPYGSRLSNVGMYRQLEDTWELMIDKHNYQDCKVVAWMERRPVYEGKT